MAFWQDPSSPALPAPYAAGTAQAFINGFGSMAYAAMLISFAGAIFVALAQGRIVDTIVTMLVAPLQHLTLTPAPLP